jgi:predicted RNA-binding protein Jag
VRNKKKAVENMTQKSGVETMTVSTRITKPTQKALLGFLARDAHINVADYLRDLIRKDLERHGVKVLETVTE